MSIITSSEELKDYCKDLAKAEFITVDTEFLRERTYYPKLCLIQLSAPNVEAIAIDPVAAPNIDLSPLEKIFKDTKILKVMHAGRQDMEIFYKLFGYLPAPYYDTQIAAMVCGYGEQVGYEGYSERAGRAVVCARVGRHCSAREHHARAGRCTVH